MTDVVAAFADITSNSHCLRCISLIFEFGSIVYLEWISVYVMIEPWNDASLLPPPVHTFSCHKNVGTHQLRSTCRNIIHVLSNQSPLHKESAILSRCAYKYDRKFRNDIGYKHLKKVNVALRRYLGLNLLKDVTNFSDTIPPSNDDNYLPTKQMLQYILVRLMSFSKIMLRICICCKKSAVFYLDRVKCGESHWMSLMPYALLSRIWSMSMVLLCHTCSWYADLMPWLDELEFKGVAFLPNDYTLPTNLDIWLDLNNIDNFGRFEWTLDKHIAIQSSLIEDDEGDNLDSILDYVNRINDDDEAEEPLVTHVQKLKTPLSAPEIKIIQLQDVDQGEIVSRDSFKVSSTTKMKLDVKKDDHSPANVTNTKSLQEFMSKEEQFRNENSDLSLTNHLSFMQWLALKNSMEGLLQSHSNNRKIESKFRKIWKEKCADYR